jgi:hypothetical protein
MKKLSDLFGRRTTQPTRTRTTERGDIDDTILSRINPGRIKKGYDPVSHGRLAYLLTGSANQQVRRRRTSRLSVGCNLLQGDQAQ